MRWAVGAILVAGSDLAVARQRFVEAASVNELVGLPAYYVGQTLLALALASAVASWRASKGPGARKRSVATVSPHLNAAARAAPSAS